MSKPTVLFVCVHNAGRSQMAAGWLRHLAGDSVEVRSAGSEPADRINPAAVEAMREVEPRIHQGIYDVLGVENSVRSRTSFGGTSPVQVAEQVAWWRGRV